VSYHGDGKTFLLGFKCLVITRLGYCDPGSFENRAQMGFLRDNFVEYFWSPIRNTLGNVALRKLSLSPFTSRD
jgi:hypothetical protein